MKAIDSSGAMNIFDTLLEKKDFRSGASTV